jgi:hypothetical protein
MALSCPWILQIRRGATWTEQNLFFLFAAAPPRPFTTFGTGRLQPLQIAG